MLYAYISGSGELHLTADYNQAAKTKNAGTKVVKTNYPAKYGTPTVKGEQITMYDYNKFEQGVKVTADFAELIVLYKMCKGTEDITFEVM